MIVPRAPARGFQKAANAASALSRGREPMESSALELSRVGGGSNHPGCSVSDKPGCAQRSVYPQGSPEKRFKMLKTNTSPGDTQRPGEKCGLGRFRMRIGRRRLSALAAFLTFFADTSPYRGQCLPTVTLKAETVQAFQRNVQIQEGLHDRRVNGRRPFLWIDDPPRDPADHRSGTAWSANYPPRTGSQGSIPGNFSR